jgi:acyl dehydratase
MIFCFRFSKTAFSLYPNWRSHEMLYSAGTPLPEHRVKASIEPADLNNKIQDDEYARHHGFRAGLVSGVSIFAYMSRPLAEQFGRDWLERGLAEVRFVRPVYEGEEIRVSGSMAGLDKDGTLILDYQAANNQGAVCGTGVAQLPLKAPSPEPSLDDYPAGRSKLHRAISLESLQVGDSLTPVSADFTWNIHWQYCRKAIRDLHPVYEKTMHPGWLLGRASQILAANYAIQAWIDVSCRVQSFHVLDEECTIQTRGRVQNKFEHKGDHYIELELAAFAPAGCLAAIRYTAIFRITPNAA